MSITQGDYRSTLAGLDAEALYAETVVRIRNHRRSRRDSSCRFLMDCAWAEWLDRSQGDEWLRAVQTVKGEESRDRAANQEAMNKGK